MKLSLGLTAAALAGICGAWACGGRIDGADVGHGGVGDPTHGSTIVDAGRPNAPDGGVVVTPSNPRDCTVPVPALIPPLPPNRAVDTICAGGGGAPAPSDTTDEVRATIVGRWVFCDGGKGGTVGLELGGNGRYQALAVQADHSLVPASPKVTGRYNLYGYPQVDVRQDGEQSVTIANITFPTGTDSMLVGDGQAQALYARVAASDADGTDNPPPVSDGSCSLAGTWDVTSESGNALSVFTFDALGNFEGGPAGTDLCASHVFTGTYQLSPGHFEIAESEGMGCAWDAFWIPQFDAACRNVRLVGTGDNCTGGRSFIEYNGTMTRRP